jgi:hypothetical protein
MTRYALGLQPQPQQQHPPSLLQHSQKKMLMLLTSR